MRMAGAFRFRVGLGLSFVAQTLKESEANIVRNEHTLFSDAAALADLTCSFSQSRVSDGR